MVDWPLFVLTLSGDEDRHAQLTARRGGATVRVGIDERRRLATQYTAAINRDAVPSRMDRDMTACGLSHRAIYRRIVGEGLRGAILLEDDAFLQPHFGTLVCKKGWLRCRWC